MSETVYRVEHGPTHRGPYSGTLAFGGNEEYSIYDAGRCPAPWQDGGLDKRIPGRGWDGVRFGFASLVMLRSWFLPRARRIMHGNDFVVGVYEAERVEHGDKQCVFWFDGAERVNELSLGEV